MPTPDTILTTEGLAAIQAGNLLVTPTGGAQERLADALAGGQGISGPVAATTLSASGNTNLSPTGTVTVHPSVASAMDNMAIGGATPLAGKFTTVSVTTDSGIVLTNQTSDAGATTATLTNSPTVGNPTFWVRISVNGTLLAIPAWPAV